MKWNKLPEKHPPFKTKLAIWRKDDTWGEGQLDKIEKTESGKIISFSLDSEEDGCTITDGTHWAIPTKPKE